MGHWAQESCLSRVAVILKCSTFRKRPGITTSPRFPSTHSFLEVHIHMKKMPDFPSCYSRHRPQGPVWIKNSNAVKACDSCKMQSIFSCWMMQPWLLMTLGSCALANLWCMLHVELILTIRKSCILNDTCRSRNSHPFKQELPNMRDFLLATAETIVSARCGRGMFHVVRWVRSDGSTGFIPDRREAIAMWRLRAQGGEVLLPQCAVAIFDFDFHRG